jgi:hypothetical protein
MLALEDLQMHNAVSELHHELSEWAHTADPSEFIVRRLLVDRDVITIDIVGAPKRGLDRFVVNVGKRSLTATAGTLGFEAVEWRTWAQPSFTTGHLQCWMRSTVAETCNLCY